MGPHRVKLAIVSGLLRHYPLDLALTKIQEAGYDGVELWGGQPHAYPLDMLAVGTKGEDLQLDRERLHALRELIAASGLELVCITPEQLLYPINVLVDEAPPFTGDAMRARSRRLLELSIDAAAELGCRRIVTVTPVWHWRSEGAGYVRVSKPEILDAAIDEIGRLCHYAEVRGVAILFEPLVHHDTNGIETLEEVALLFDRIDSPSLRLMLDMGHIAVTANRIGVEPVTYLRAHLERFGEKVDHIHVDDNHGTVDAHLALGEGTVDLVGMTRTLVESGYNGWFSAELSILGEYAMPDTAERLLRETCASMRSLLARAEEEVVAAGHSAG
jgi:fructoselysine 3-epimerase